MPTNIFQIKSIDELNTISNYLMDLFEEKKIRILTLNGDLGAGKTTLTKNLLSNLGVKEDVISPTFVYRRDYRLNVDLFRSVNHYDMYRLDKGESQEDKIKFLEQIGFFENLEDRNNLIIVEWFENILEIISDNFSRIDLYIENLQPDRKITLRIN